MGKSIFAYQTVPNILLSIKMKGNLIELLAYCLKKREPFSNRLCDFFFDHEVRSSSKKYETIF